MQKISEKNRTSEDLPRRVLARVVAERLPYIQGGGAQPLTIIQTGGAMRDLSDTGGSDMDLYVG